MEPIKTLAPYKVYLNGLNFTRAKGDPKYASDADGAPIRIIFPGRIFSHLLIKVDKCKGVFKVGFYIGPLIFRIDLMSGTVEKPPKCKLEAHSL